MSRGWQYTLVMASLTKRVLQSKMTPAMRLEFLGHLEKMVDGRLTPAVIGMVEPMCDQALELSMEASKLGWSQALDLYADKWDVFAALNPSLQAAYDEACRPWKQTA